MYPESILVILFQESLSLLNCLIVSYVVTIYYTEKKMFFKIEKVVLTLNTDFGI